MSVLKFKVPIILHSTPNYILLKYFSVPLQKHNKMLMKLETFYCNVFFARHLYKIIKVTNFVYKFTNIYCFHSLETVGNLLSCDHSQILWLENCTRQNSVTVTWRRIKVMNSAIYVDISWSNHVDKHDEEITSDDCQLFMAMELRKYFSND